MGERTIVTFGTDGFRDYVKVPEGHEYNLGSISILNFVASLAGSRNEAKQALDTFLEAKEATLLVDREALTRLLTPRRTRWAGEEVPSVPSQDSPMTPKIASVLPVLDQIDDRLRFLEANVGDTPYAKDVTARTAQEVLSLTQSLLPSRSVTASQPSSKTAAVDDVALRELQLFMENDSALDRQKVAILHDVLADMKANEYNPKSGAKHWLPWVDKGAKEFARENDVDAGKMFPKPLREELARNFAASFAKAIQNGEYDHLKTSDKKASEEAHALGVALTHKIGRSLEILDTCKDGCPPLVASDLHRIASDLREIVSSGGTAEGSKDSLLTLTRRADHVLSYVTRRQAKLAPALPQLLVGGTSYASGFLKFPDLNRGR